MVSQEIIQEYKDRFLKVANPQTSQQWEEFNRLNPVIEVIKKIDEQNKNLAQAQELADSTDDPELKKLAHEDLVSVNEKLTNLNQKLEEIIKEEQSQPDPNDSRNAIMEIRAGTGGEEAALFAGDLLRMYTLFAQKKGLKVNILDRSLSSTGGIKAVTLEIKGKDAFGLLKRESGVHRVQRIPVTESSGRIHTSTASVAVLPEAEEVDIEIKTEDIRIDVFRATGAGGQCVNKTDSAVRITHIPSGIVVSCQEGKSQLQNKKTAMSILRSRLLEQQIEEEQEKRANLRRSQIGRAKRSEKIRTYNYPQSRITDHRTKTSWHNLNEILDGYLDEVIEDTAQNLVE